MPNQSTIMDINSVIYLGHTIEQPLIRPSSELSDGLEPHGLIYSVRQDGHATDVQRGGGRVYPGWCGEVGTGRGIPGY